MEEYTEEQKIAFENKIIESVAGSNAYGTNLPTSDYDLRSVFVLPKDNFISPFSKIEQVAFEGDNVSYEFTKFFTLLLEQNPNIVEILWADAKDITVCSPAGEILLKEKENFLSRKVAESYVGYAMQQLKRIKGHNKWINNPQPDKEYEPKDFVNVVWNSTSLKEYNKKPPFVGYVAFSAGDNNVLLFKSETFGKAENYSWIDQRGYFKLLAIKDFANQIEGKKPDIVVKFNKKLYEESHDNWKNYWSWKKNRNVARSELEEKFGFDTKHAMHLIRLLKMGKEILEEGVVYVKRKDFKELLDIRSGSLSYDEVIRFAESLQKEISTVREHSKLPESLDREYISKIYKEVYESSWDSLLNKKSITCKR